VIHERGNDKPPLQHESQSGIQQETLKTQTPQTMPKMHQIRGIFQETVLTGISVRHVQHLKKNQGNRWTIWKQFVEDDSGSNTAAAARRRSCEYQTQLCW